MAVSIALLALVAATAAAQPSLVDTLPALPEFQSHRITSADPTGGNADWRTQGNGTPPFRSGNYYYSVAYWYQTEPHAPFPKLPEPAACVSWAKK